MNSTLPSAPSDASSSTAAERIVEASENLLNRLSQVNDRLARTIARAAGAGPEETSGRAVPPRSSGLLYRSAEEMNDAHDVISLINNQLDIIDSLI